MGQPILIYGKSGSGKSRSLKNFESDEIVLFNVENKFLPFRKKFKYEIKTDDYSKIFKALGKLPTKVAVIDDAGYLLTNMFMKGHRINKGTSTFDLYNDIADNFWHLFDFIKCNLSDDTIVYIIMHEEESKSGDEVGVKTIGRLLSEKVCIEGMVTVALRCMSEDGRHFFRTVTDGSDITKAPEEMFESDEIENDLKFVDTTIRNYMIGE